MSENPTLSCCVFRYYQDGNTAGTTSETETLDVELEYVPGCDEDEDPFVVVKSESGWSINEPADLMRLLNDCLKAAREARQ